MLRVTRSIWRRDDRSRADHRAGSVQTHHVDIDPRTAELGQQLVADSPTCAVVMADLTKPDEVLSNPEFGKLVDLTQPVGVLCTAVLHFIADDVDPWGMMKHYVDALAPGSYLAFFTGMEMVPPYEGADAKVAFTGDWGCEDPVEADDDVGRWAYAGVTRRS